MKILKVTPLNHFTPGLFDLFEPQVLAKYGHEFTTSPHDAEVVWFDIHVCQPFDSWILEVVLTRKVPVVVFDFHDHIGTSSIKSVWAGHDNWSGLPLHEEWASFVDRAFKADLVKLYFLRKKQKSFPCPSFVKPIDLCFYEGADKFPTCTASELSCRPNDVCFIGNTSTWRGNFIASLLRDGRLKVDWLFTFRRLGTAEWLDRHRHSKMFIEADGGGYGSERPHQLLGIAPMLRQRNDCDRREDWTDGVDCLEAGSDGGFASREDIDHILEVVNSPKLHDLYLNGYERLKSHHSPQARSEYVFGCMGSVSWPSPL